MGSFHEQEKNQKMMDDMGDRLFRIGYVVVLVAAIIASVAIFAHLGAQETYGVR